MGAWIEIDSLVLDIDPNEVAPHMGAWIEIITRWFCENLGVVAPHMGAWIEIAIAWLLAVATFGRTPHGCVD